MYSNRGKKIVASSVATALILSISISTAPALAATVPAASLVVLAAQQQDNAAKEDTLVQTVWEKTDWVRLKFQPEQLREFAVSLQSLSDWLWDTGSITDAMLMKNCLDHAEKTLDWSAEQNSQDKDTQSALTAANVSFDNAVTAFNKIVNASNAELSAGLSSTSPDSKRTVSGTSGFVGDVNDQSAGVQTPATPDVTNSESLFTAPTAYTTSTAIFAANGSFLLAAGTAQANSMGNFKSVVTYPNFTDVPSTVWYFNNVKTATEYGLVKGTSATTFAPTNNVSIQEAIVMAARVRCIYEWGSNSVHYPNKTPVGNAASWATAEINYAIANGLIESGDFQDYTRSATRAEMAHIFANVLPTSTNVYLQTNTIDDGAIPDVTSSTKYGADIYKLYRAGVLAGSGDNHAANPTANITRAETAAIISRLPRVASRPDFDMLNPTNSNGAATSNYLADGITKSPYAGHTIYVGTATMTTGGQPRKTAPSGSATSQIKTLYGFHNYNSANQAEYDAVVAHMQKAYNATVAKGNAGIDGACGLSAESWDVVDDIIAGRSYNASAWSSFLADSFPTLSASISSPKEQAKVIKLYGQYSALKSRCQAVGGQNTGVSAYDAFFRQNGSCVSSAQVQLLAADMLGIDCTTYAGNDHMFAVLKIQGVYFSGEFEQAYASLASGIGSKKTVTEWTSASAPTK